MWRWLKQFPKFLLALAIIVASVGVLFVWKTKRAMRAAFQAGPAQVVDTTKQQALVLEKHDRLLLVDNDLYDLDSGAVIFKAWLSGGMPVKLFYEPDTKTFLALYERALVRYGPDGKQRAALAQKSRLALSDDYKWLLYVKDKEIWRADVDLKALKLTDEKKLTAIEQFNDTYFAENIFFATEKTLVLRNLNRLLRVNLETGDVKPTQLPSQGLVKHKSPDGKCGIGWERGQLIRYDVDDDDIKAVPLAREAVTDFLWLDNERCVGIAGGKKVILYERSKNRVTEVTAVPAGSNQLGEPSPDGRLFFCIGRSGGVLVDLQKKAATPVIGGAGVFWVSNDTFAVSRDITNSDLRGMFLQRAGEAERKVSPDPYFVTKSLTQSYPFMLAFKSVRLVVFVTNHGLSKMKPDGTELAELTKLSQHPVRVIGIQDWKSE